MEAFVEVRNHVPFKRIEFYVVITSVIALCISILFVSVTVAYALGKSVNTPAAAETSQAIRTQSVPADAGDQNTFHGMLTDSFCSARHARNSNRSSTECARICVRRGANYLLVSSDASYVVRGNKMLLNSLAGQRVTVVGALKGNSIGVRSISAAD